MDGFKAYRFYLALKLHFTTEKYNVFESKGAVKASRDKFNLRNDHYIFEKFSRKFNVDKDLIQFMACNFIYGNQNFIYSGSEAEDNHVEWQRRKQSITKILFDDCSTILNQVEEHDLNGKDVFYCTKNNIPYIINLYMAKKICIESIRILDDFIHFIPEWRSHTNMNLLFGDDIRRIEKSIGFIKYRNEKVIPIISNLQRELLLNQNG
jgi:hypothetical protein